MSTPHLAAASSNLTIGRLLAWRRQWPLWLTLLLDSAVCFCLARLVYQYQAHPFDTDEVNHALPSLLMAHAIHQGHWADLLRLIYAQSFYPPATAVVKALVFVLFGPSVLHARLFSVACLFLAILVLYALGAALDDRYGRFAGFVAAALALTARPLLVNAALSMVELPGLLLSLLFLWAYGRALKRARPRRLLLTSLLLALTFLTKYTYGVAVLLTLALMEATLFPNARSLLAGPEWRRRISRRWRYLLGPFALVMALWFLHPDKLATFIDYTQPLAHSEPWLSGRNAGYYLRSLAIHSLPSILWAPVTAAALLWAVWRWRRLCLRPVLFYFLSGMALIMLVNHPAAPRFTLTFVPAAHVLTGLMLADLWRLRQKRPLRARATLLLGLVGLSVLLSLPPLWRRAARLNDVLAVMVESDPAIGGVIGWVQQQVPPGETLFLVNYWDQLSPGLFTWYQGLRQPADLERPLSAALMTAPTPDALAAARQAVQASHASYLVLFEGGPWGEPFWPDYTAALADRLLPVAQQEFAVTSFDALQDWLEANSETDPAWLAVQQDPPPTLTIRVIVYRLQPPQARAAQPQ